MRRLLSLCLCGFLISLALARPVFAAIETVEDIKIEAEAEDAAAAKAKAFAKARTEAVQKVFSNYGQSLPALSKNQIEEATIFIDVVDEKTTDQKYIATLRVGIDTRYLPGLANGKPASALKAKFTGRSSPRWVLLIPVHRTAAGPKVWSRHDPWVVMWDKPLGRRAVDYIVTKGDTDDQEILPPSAAATAQADSLRQLAAKYNAPAVALVVLDTAFSEDEATSGVVEVDLWTPARGLMSMRMPAAGDDITTAAQEKALKSLDLLANSSYGIDVAGTPAAQELVGTIPPITAGTFVSAVPESEASDQGVGEAIPPVIHVPLYVTLESPGRWAYIHSQLASIPGLVTTPQSMSGSEAELMMHYTGTREQLVEQLRARQLMSSIDNR